MHVSCHQEHFIWEIRDEDSPFGTALPPTIICPKCKHVIKLTESLAEPLIDSIRGDYEQRLVQKDVEGKVFKRESPGGRVCGKRNEGRDSTHNGRYRNR